MQDNYICKIASLDEVMFMFDFYIEHDVEDRENWTKWKEGARDNYLNKRTINYIGVLNGKTICEATAIINTECNPEVVDLVDDKTAYLEAFRTLPEYRNQGYFSKLYRFMIEDLKSRGYERATIGVEPKETRNKAIYNHYGFTEHVKDATEKYPDGTTIDVEYYSMKLK